MSFEFLLFAFFVLSCTATIKLWLCHSLVQQQGYSAFVPDKERKFSQRHKDSFATCSYFLAPLREIFLLNKIKVLFPIVLFLLLISGKVYSQDKPVEKVIAVKDSAVTKKEKTDTTTKKKMQNPKVAAIRSAILPGLGQIYNKKYWKLPIIYGALGTSGAVFVYNIRNYKDLKFAYAAKYKASLPPPQRDSTDYRKIKATLLPLSLESLRFNRDQFRRNVDYSALVFMLLWGLNVVDAAVDAHLKSFDVGPDLSLQIQPGHSEMAGTNGVSLVLHIGK